MTNREAKLGWLLICVGLSGACGDDEGGDDGPIDSGSRNDAAIDAGARNDASPSAGDAGSSPQACLQEVYEELDDQCKTCLCTTNAEAAPTCDEPCWDFLACSFLASAGPCAQFPRGSQENSQCIAMTCGTELATGGAGPKASAYSASGITAACLVPSSSAPAACSASLAKIRPAL